MSTPAEVYIEGMRKALQLAEPGGQLELEILDSGFRPLLAERDALKADNERLREALRESTGLLESIIRSKGKDWLGYPYVERLISKSQTALAEGKGEK